MSKTQTVINILYLSLTSVTDQNHDSDTRTHLSRLLSGENLQRAESRPSLSIINDDDDDYVTDVDDHQCLLMMMIIVTDDDDQCY